MKILNILAHIGDMDQQAYQISQHDQPSNGIESMAVQAARLNFWIFDTQTKIWYTPEEFIQTFAKAPYQEGLLHRFKTLDPMQGLMAGDMQIEKKQILNNRVLDYYRSKIK